MKLAGSFAVMVGAFTFLPLSASAQGDLCPRGYSNDDCDQWGLERADKILTDAVAETIVERSKLVSQTARSEAIEKTVKEAHRTWLLFRDAECKAYVAGTTMSARTEKGRYADCMLLLTQQRIAEMKKF